MPSYQFNTFTGRLKQSTSLNPLTPLTPVRLDRAEDPNIMFDTVKTKPVKAPAGTAAYSSKVDPVMLKRMQQFQKNIEAPVYLLGGPKDKIGVGITVALIAVGTCLSAYNFGTRIFTK